MRKLAIAVLCAALFLLLAQPRPAIADNNFGITPEKKLAKTLEELADVCFECGDTAKGKGLYTYARSYFNYGLMYDPDHKKIRKTMGYKKKKGEWILEEDMVPLTDKINEAKRDELTRKLWIDTETIRHKAADELLEFVKDSELDLQQRMLALWHAARFDPINREVLKATRSSTSETSYRHQLDDQADTNRIVWIQRAQKGEKIDERTPYETATGMNMAKRRTDYLVVHVEIGEKSEPWAEALSQYGEACRTRIFELLGTTQPKKPDEDPKRLHYSVFSDRERFARFVDKCSGIPDASERKVRGEQSGGTPVYNPYGAVWFYPRLENDFGLRDGLAHDLAYKEIVRNTGGEQFYWLLRGFAYQVSTQMNGSIHSKFFATKSTGVIDTGGAEALPGFGDSPAGWRVMVGMELAAGTALTLTDLCKGRPQDYTNREMAAAYCLTDYLLHEKKEKLAAFLNSAYKEFVARYKEKKNPEDALELMNRLLESLEMDEQEFMDAFRIWALANYFDLNSAEEGK
ncbi:MAG: hypothetical protein R3E76_01000 [Planctomycetota bacterium]